MRLPGFNAENSAYRTSNTYYSVSGVSTGEQGGAVIPQICFIRGYREEQQYFDCFLRCRSRGGSFWGCRRTCCTEVAGCSDCIFM